MFIAIFQAIFVNGNENHVIEVPENELNYKIGDLSASDDDTADKHEFKITEPVGGLFLVEGNLLKVGRNIFTVDFIALRNFQTLSY